MKTAQNMLDSMEKGLIYQPEDKYEKETEKLRKIKYVICIMMGLIIFCLFQLAYTYYTLV